MSRFTPQSRDVKDCSVETLAADLFAVVERLQLERVGLFAHHAGALAAMLVAASCPDRVIALNYLATAPVRVLLGAPDLGPILGNANLAFGP